MTWIKSGWSKNAVIVLFGILVALVLGEMLIRIVSPRAYTEDARLGMVGSGIGHDANGFRNVSILEHAEVVVIGDSQTYGNNVEREEAWPQQLSLIASTTVYQMAYGGYSPLQYAELAQDALQFSPKLLVVGFYSRNDLLETYTSVYDQNASWSDLRDPNFVLPATTSDPLEFRRELQTGLSRDSLEFKIWKIRYWVRLHSRLYELLGDATRNIRERIGVAKTMSEKHDQFESFAEQNPDVAYIANENPNTKTILSPAYRLEGVSLDEPRTREGWRITRENIIKIRDTAKQGAGIPAVFVFIPTKEFVYLTAMKKASGSIPDEFERYFREENRLQNEFEKFCVANGLYCHSVLSGMANALLGGEKIYGETMDGHPLAPGYRAIAESVWIFLQKTHYEGASLTSREADIE